MRKLTLYCIATTALLALALSAHASPGSAIARAAGLNSASGVGPVILVSDDKKATDNKKKSHRERTVNKQQYMRY